MEHIMSRVRSRAGESLGEVLVSMLVIALAILMMTSMVVTSLRMDRQARDADKTLYAQMGNAEEKGTEIGSTTATLDKTPPDPSTPSLDVPAHLYGTGGATYGLVSYGN